MLTINNFLLDIIHLLILTYINHQQWGFQALQDGSRGLILNIPRETNVKKYREFPHSIGTI